MNRSILIVICDFLLVSLLVFSSPDVNRVTGEDTDKQIAPDIQTNQVDARQDLASVMQVALAEERRNRDRLVTELASTRNTLGDKEKQVQTFQQDIRSREEQAQRLQLQQGELRQQFTAAQTSLQALQQKLESSSAEALMTKEQLEALRAENRKQNEQAAELQKQLSHLEKSNQMVLSEKQQLSTQLQVAEVEKRHAAEQAQRMAEEVKIERQEKARLAEGVKALASQSTELAQEIRENRPLAPNTIFNEFLTNRVQARFLASRPGLLGEASRRGLSQTVLATDGTNTYALCHIQDTPLVLYTPGTDWEGLAGTLTRNNSQVQIRSMSFSWPDPRVVWMPVTPTEVRQLGSVPYRVSADPFKFQDAVLVGGQDESYYGECRFQIDPSTPDYVQLDRSFMKGLFGRFNPSRGDLVFSKTGELLGVMINGTYCLMMRKFDPTATLRFGPDVRAQRTGEILSQLHTQVMQMPLKLQ